MWNEFYCSGCMPGHMHSANGDKFSGFVNVVLLYLDECDISRNLNEEN